MTKGHICKNCKKEHEWPAYVFAHWNDPLTHTCDCGQIVQILAGKVAVIKKSEK